MKKNLLLLLYLFFISASLSLFSQDSKSSLPSQKKLPANPELVLLQEDLLVKRHYDSLNKQNGFLLYIRKKPFIESVMLCDTTRDPQGKQDNFAYRATFWNEFNGDEKRILNGKFLDSQYAKYTLISSTPVSHDLFGQAFCIFIPETVVYGYPWSRKGSVTVADNTFVNIRTFSKKYGDYEGLFQDNPFMFNFTVSKKTVKETDTEKKSADLSSSLSEEKKESEEEPLLDEGYNPDTADTFTKVAQDSGGKVIFSKGTSSLKEDINNCLLQIDKTKKADLVFAIDTTGSMVEELDEIRKVWLPDFIKKYPSYTDLRVALVLYRDFGDSYLYKNLPVKIYHFTSDMKVFYRNIDGIYIKGNEGGDIPEAVYEALYAALNYLSWRDDAQKKIILLGDAPAHEIPRGPKKISREITSRLASEKKVSCDCIILPY